MRVLGIETSTRAGSVAWVDSDVVRAERAVGPDGGSGGAGRTLAPALADLERAVDVEWPELDLIAVGLGPGGYTGTRLAIATARGLAFAIGKPIVGVVSTAAFAAHPDVPDGRVVVVIDAKNDQVYVAEYRRAAGVVAESSAPEVAFASEVASRIDADTIVVGDGAPRVLARAGGVSPRFAAPAIVPRAIEVARLGAARWARGERDDEASLLPLYLRVSEAERRFRERRDSAARPLM